MTAIAWSVARLSAPLLLAAVVPACGHANPEETWRGVVRDSAGVRIIENPAEPLWRPGEEWRVQQALRIAVAESDPAYRCCWYGGMAVDDDGRIYVADRRARQVRVFDADGMHLTSLGRPGQGAAELGQILTGVFARGDSVFVLDRSKQRFAVFLLGGGDPSAIPFDVFHGELMGGVLDGSGRLLIQLRSVSRGSSASEAVDAIVVFGTGGVASDTVALLPRGEMLPLDGTPRIRLFPPEPVWDAGHDGRLVSGLNSEYRIEVREPGGAMRHVITWPGEPNPITDADRARLRTIYRRSLEMEGVPATTVAWLIEGMEFSEHYPAFATLLAGPRGTTWVERVRTAADVTGDVYDFHFLQSGVWDVFDALGRYLGPVRTPERSMPILFRGSTIYGIERGGVDAPVVLRLDVRGLLRAAA